MSHDWRDGFLRLRAEFLELARQHSMVFHLMAERMRGAGYPDDELVPAWLGVGRWTVRDQHLMRREMVRPPAGDGTGYASGVWCVRDGFLCGDHDPCQRFKQLGAVAGDVLASMPTNAVELLPSDIRTLTKPVAELPDENLSDWLLLLHRFGWIAAPGDLVVASRWFWKEGSSVPFQQSPPAMIGDNIPTYRFFSIIGLDYGNPMHVGDASAWAIDWLLKITETRAKLPVELIDHTKSDVHVTPQAFVADSTQKNDDGKSPPMEGHWLTGMSLADMANRLNNISTKKARTILKQYGLRQMGNRQTWTVRLDEMPSNLRAQLEKRG